MKSLTALPALAVLAIAPAIRAATVPGVEISGFGVPAAGSDFKDHTGFGVSGALTAAYDFPDSHYGEQLLAQFEGLYVHTSGTNTLGGASHRETLDAGFGMLNFGLGARNETFGFTVYVGAGFGGGSLDGAAGPVDLAMNTAFQVKPRVSWYFARQWAVFAEYRFLRSGDDFGSWFGGDDARHLEMHAVGLGVSYSF